MPTCGKCRGEHGAAAAAEDQPERADDFGHELLRIHVFPQENPRCRRGPSYRSPRLRNRRWRGPYSTVIVPC